MASQIPLDPKYYPSDFQTQTFNLGTGGGPNTLLLYFDRDVVLDEAVLTVPDNVTNSDPGVNLKLLKMTGSGLPSYASPVAGQTDVTTVLTLTTSSTTYPFKKTWADLTTSGFAASSTADARGNVIAAGSYLWLCSSASITGVTGPVSLMLRWRSQL
jgi:hypothetical protein